MKIEQYIAIAIIVLIASAFNGHMDHLQFHDSAYNPAETWKNKYAQDSEGNLVAQDGAVWYYFGLYKPAYKEKFTYSSTLFVSLTDRWHRSKTISFALFRLALVLSIAFLWRINANNTKNVAIYTAVYFVLWGIQAIGFHIVYTVFN